MLIHYEYDRRAIEETTTYRSWNEVQTRRNYRYTFGLLYHPHIFMNIATQRELNNFQNKNTTLTYVAEQ